MEKQLNLILSQEEYEFLGLCLFNSFNDFKLEFSNDGKPIDYDSLSDSQKVQFSLYDSLLRSFFVWDKYK